MSKSDYLENAILDHVLGGGDFTRPATVYVALYTAAPNDAGGGTEVSGGSYSRLPVTNNSTNFPAAQDGSKSNGTLLTFPTATASWGSLVAFALFDAASGGNMLYHGAITTPKTIDNGDTAEFPIGSLTFTED